MMLNMFLALRTAVDFYHSGDCSRALGVIEMMQPSIEAWQAEFRDPDIEADWALLSSLERNLGAACSAKRPIPPRDFSGSCFFI